MSGRNHKPIAQFQDLQSVRGIFALLVLILLWVGGDLLALQTRSGVGCAWYPNGGLAIGFAAYFGWPMMFVFWLIRLTMAITIWKIPLDSLSLISFTLIPSVGTVLLSIPLRRAIEFKGRVDSVRVAIIYTQLAFVGCAAMAIIFLTINWLTGLVSSDNFVGNLISWFAGDLIGFVTMGPLALVVICPFIMGRFNKLQKNAIPWASVGSLLLLFATVFSILFFGVPERHFNYWHLTLFIFLFSAWNLGLGPTTVSVAVGTLGLMLLELTHPSNVGPLEQQAFLTMITGGALFLALLFDENRRRFHQSARYAQSLEQVAEAQSQFFNNLCHEVRNPLHLIVGYSEVMSERNPSSNTQDLGPLHENSRNLLRLVERLTAIGRNESSSRGEPSPIDLREWLNERLPEWEARAREKSLNLTLKFASNEDYVVLAQPEPLKLAVDELMDNALKFTDKGCVCILVEHAEGHFGKSVLLKIKDTGIGLGTQNFSIRTFMAQENTVTRNFSGLGVGLSLAQSLIEGLNGRLMIEPAQEGQGTLVIAEFLAV